jgi:hypothetical protein
MPLVIDADVVSFLFKHDTRAAFYVPRLDGHMLLVSFQTVAELEQWALYRGWGPHRRQQLAQHLRRYVVEDSSPAVCRLWSEVGGGGRGRDRATGERSEACRKGTGRMRKRSVYSDGCTSIKPSLRAQA